MVRLFCQRNDLALVEVNFEQTYALTQLFSTNDPKEIIKTLEVLHNTRIEVAKTVLFLDEIQANPEAIRSLRYFFSLIIRRSFLDEKLKAQLMALIEERMRRLSV